MDWTRYTEEHAHPSIRCSAEVVAYKTLSGAWDVYVCEPRGTVPELEGSRVDDDHILFETINDVRGLDSVAQQIDKLLGPPYEVVPYFRESGGRRVVDRIFSHLKKVGATGAWIRGGEGGGWELRIRRRDFAVAAAIAESNVD